MPELPSGLQFAISRDHLFDHGGNWFKCPEGHFWYWDAAPEMGPAPFDINSTVETMPKHAPAPKSRQEVKHFIYVLELNDDLMYSWGGERLSQFPEFIELDDDDLAAWNAWINRPETDQFLDETIEMCQRLVEVSKRASGHAAFEAVTAPDEDGWAQGNLRIPTSGN